MHPRIQELLAHLDAQRAVLRAAFDAVPPALRDREPAPGRWSAANVVEHLAIVETRVAAALTERIASARKEGLAGETAASPVLPGMSLARIVSRANPVQAPEAVHPSGLKAEAAWEALERAGVTVRDVLKSADGLALNDITHPHPRFGPLSVYEWFGVLGSHEARHAAQISEIAATTM